MERLAAHFTGRQVMDVICLHGMYQTLGCLINTWGVDLDAQVAARLPPDVTESSFSGR